MLHALEGRQNVLLMTGSVMPQSTLKTYRLSLFLQFYLGRRLEHTVLFPSYSLIVLVYTMDLGHFTMYLP